MTPAATTAPASLLDAAVAYAGRGWRVLPVHTVRDGRCTCGKLDRCTSPGKHPWTRHGLKDASSDPARIRRWWRRWPHANVGIATGAASGLIVLDIDPRNGGDVALADLEATDTGKSNVG